ncbi:peptidylprolyl isomerase [Roseobacter sp. HKCCA0434]|uniref:peptidylprolyl isomerase n=1 Tax=Roseobacter sp. HKCCA0434 TaxID=3079297 RepID=UPI002905DEA1|nr:peptidylprolyl isomerase [Roseobacter sp. HKCCA0434]
MTRLMHALVAMILLALPVQAQTTPFAPAIVVNEDMVTYYDLNQRRAYYGLLGIPDALIEDRVVEDLTNEALMRQEARRQGITISREELQEAIANFAAQRNLSPDELAAGFARSGIDFGTLTNQIAAQLGWRAAMQRRFRSRAIPDENDLEEALVLDATGSTREVLLAEIAIPFAERGEARTRDLILQLASDLQAGGDFAAAARRYSRAATASSGGEIGWIPVDNLPPPMRAEVDLIDVGGVSRPIPITRGVSLLKVVSERQGQATDSGAVTLSYARATFPITGDAEAARARAVEARRGINTCGDIERGGFGPNSGRFGPAPLSAVDPSLFSALATAQEGQVSQPVRTGDSFSIIVLCSRDLSLDEETRRRVQDQIFSDRLGAYADGYMQELRRDAVIEIR